MATRGRPLKDINEDQVLWSLAEQNKYLVSLATTIYFTGVMIGGAVFGQLGDKFGRKPITLICLYSHIALAVGVYFSQSFEAFTLLRFFVGAFVQGVQTCLYALLNELTSLRYRPIVGDINGIFWAVGTLWLATLSWLIQDWRNIQLALCLPSLITLVLPESVLWLISKNKLTEAKTIFVKLSKCNQQSITDEDLDLTKPKVNESIQYSFHHLVKAPNIRARTLLLCYIWITASIGYYALALAVSPVTTNRFFNWFVSSLTELPAFALSIVTLKYFSRRKSLMFFYSLTGVACIIAGSLKNESTNSALILALIGKFGISAAFVTIDLYTVELFPTVVRTLGMGTCIFWSRVGGMIAPQILLLGGVSINILPTIIIGVMALLAALDVYFLPETFGKLLPNTIEEIEKTDIN
ncbi:solute carrier family 22 member 15-like [Clytia hemisphaerica]|uniref:solute carrier family 22 member 15-like n=1 Tax=Clytia hemisphaerica TaxID=252671 RepID=UPI0034D67C87